MSEVFNEYMKSFSITFLHFGQALAQMDFGRVNGFVLVSNWRHGPGKAY